MRPIQIIVFCLYMCSLNLYAQVSVTGTVNDNTGESLPGVSILAKDGDRTFGSTTDINGRYEIKVNQGLPSNSVLSDLLSKGESRH